uniref:Uncharacterized protein n=1 Tax=Caulerpa cliftonii TaxID=1004391 RepID=A0A1C9JBV7_9CHLO|nr:hypothetical protein [Caulerpa cliftonii]AOP19321.1 hypothetical protein [Caulerpa cliftonii]
MPSIIHSDQNPIYVCTPIQKWAHKHQIKLSTTAPRVEEPRLPNQVAESINAAIKDQFIKLVLKSNSFAFKQWRKTWPDPFKKLRIQNKIKNPTFRSFFFELMHLIKKATQNHFSPNFAAFKKKKSTPILLIFLFLRVANMQ